MEEERKCERKAVIDQFIFDSKIALLVNFILFTRNCVYGSACLSIVGARNNMYVIVNKADPFLLFLWLTSFINER